MKSTISFLLLLFISITTSAQKSQALYFGPGFGFDHGGLGIKASYFPEKHFGIFGGAGYNFATVGVNGGLMYSMMPDKRVTPVLTAMYGYNAVIKTSYSNAVKENVVYYGLTVGAGVDIRLGRSKENKLNINLLVPLRSAVFFEDYNYLHQNGTITQPIVPIGISLGWDMAVFSAGS